RGGGGHEPRYGWVHEQVLPDGRWRLAPRVLVERLRDELDHLDDARPECVLTARRQLRNMNSARYERAEGRGSEQPWVRCNPDDVARLGLTDGKAVVLTNEYGTTTGVLRIDERVRPGVVSMTHGWIVTNPTSL